MAEGKAELASSPEAVGEGAIVSPFWPDSTAEEADSEAEAVEEAMTDSPALPDDSLEAVGEGTTMSPA